MNSMHGNRQNLWFAVCGTSLSLLLAIAGAWAQSTAPNEPRTPAAAAGPKLAEEEFKNIQALKGVPADQVIPSMQFIATLARPGDRFTIQVEQIQQNVPVDELEPACPPGELASITSTSSPSEAA